jgi:hypothetical protein
MLAGLGIAALAVRLLFNDETPESGRGAIIDADLLSPSWTLEKY